MNTSHWNRCDEIIALIDSCLAEYEPTVAERSQTGESLDVPLAA
jgi:hypothetical protein